MARGIPNNLASSYYRDMLKRIRMMEKLVQKAYEERIVPLLLKLSKEIQREAKIELKTNASILGGLSLRLRQLYEQTRTQISTELSHLSLEIQQIFSTEVTVEIARKFVNKVNVTVKRDVESEIVKAGGHKAKSKLIAIDLLGDQRIQSHVKSYINQNVALIKTIPQRYFNLVEETIYKGLEEGLHVKELGNKIQEVGGVTERRGKFIARDQLGSVYGKLTRQRQESIGLKRFKWVTSKDERVRDSHKALDGRIFEWDKGAEGPDVDPTVRGKRPGEDFNCRCTAAPVLEDIDELLSSLEKGED